MQKIINKLPWSTVIMMSMTLGLAPFAPPHVYEKLTMLFSGTLVNLMDWGDLLFHGTPWLLLMAKTITYLMAKNARTNS